MCFSAQNRDDFGDKNLQSESKIYTKSEKYSRKMKGDL